MELEYTDAGVKNLINIRELCVVGNCGITDEGIKNMKYLQKLQISDNSYNSEISITDNGIKEKTTITDLSFVNVKSVTNDGLKNLQLQNLKIWHYDDEIKSKITWDGIKHMPIKQIVLRNSQISSNDIDKSNALRTYTKLFIYDKPYLFIRKGHYSDNVMEIKMANINPTD